MGNTASAAALLITKTEKNPGGTQVEVFDGFRMALAANRAQFYLDVAPAPVGSAYFHSICPSRSMMRPTRTNKPNGYLLGSYRIATAPEPNSSRLTSLKSRGFDSPANNAGP